MHVVLVAPQIATNTGNIIRLSANTGVSLHLVAPLGFSMDSTLLKRAGLDYHDLACVTTHDDIIGCLRDIAAQAPTAARFTLRSQGSRPYDSVEFGPDDVLIFGAEASGLTAPQLEQIGPATALRIPMAPGNRSLNLANAVAVVVFEAWRQQGFRGAASTPNAQSGHGQSAETLLSPPFDQ